MIALDNTGRGGSTGMSAADYHAMMAAGMTEKSLQTVVTQFAKQLGWLVYHTYDSRRSEPGYPDLHLVHPTHGITLFRELKTQTGRLTSPQKTWLNALVLAGHDAAVWRPIDWFENRIDQQLTSWTRQ